MCKQLSMSTDQQISESVRFSLFSNVANFFSRKAKRFKKKEKEEGGQKHKHLKMGILFLI